MRIDWENVAVRLNTVGSTRWQTGVTVDRTWNAKTPLADHDLWYIAGGRGRVVTPTGHAELSEGTCLWLRPGRAYDIRQQPAHPLTVRFIHFDLLDQRGRPLPRDTPLPPEAHRPKDRATIAAITARLLTITRMKGSAYSWAPPHGDVRRRATAFLTALLMDLDAESSRYRVETVRPISSGRAVFREDIVAELAGQMLETPGRVPTVREMARRTGYSEAHFSRLFSAVMGRSPRRFLIQVRADRAQHLLQTTSLSIGRIAAELGYADIYHFSKQFKAVVGVTPTQFRRAR